MKITLPELYAHIIQIIGNEEDISWTCFNNFLMGNSILILAWATIYCSTSSLPLKEHILCSISIIGGLSGIVWSDMGRRTRKYVDTHVKQAQDIERIKEMWVDIADGLKPFHGGIKVFETGHWWSSNMFVHMGFPILLTILYMIMLIASIL